MDPWWILDRSLVNFLDVFLMEFRLILGGSSADSPWILGGFLMDSWWILDVFLMDSWWISFPGLFSARLSEELVSYWPVSFLFESSQRWLDDSRYEKLWKILSRLFGGIPWDSFINCLRFLAWWMGARELLLQQCFFFFPSRCWT